MKISIRIAGVAAYAEIIKSKERGVYILTTISVPSELRRRGLARAILQQACIWADEKECVLRLQVVPFLEPFDMWVAMLKKLYAEYGFVAVDNSLVMERQNVQR